MDGLQAIIWSQ